MKVTLQRSRQAELVVLVPDVNVVTCIFWWGRLDSLLQGGRR
jgi:hypothetical protein